MRRDDGRRCANWAYRIGQQCSRAFLQSLGGKGIDDGMTPTECARDPLFQQMLCEMVSESGFMSKSCLALGMERVEVYAQLKVNEAFAQMFAAARRAGLDKLAEDLIDVADDTSTDMTNRAAVRRAELRIKTRQWALAKWDPGRYGEKLQVEQKTASVQIPVTDDPVLATQAYERLMRGE